MRKTFKSFIKDFKYPLAFTGALIGSVVFFQNVVTVHPGTWVAITNLKTAQPYSTGGLLVGQVDINSNVCDYRIRVLSNGGGIGYGGASTGVANATGVKTYTSLPQGGSAILNFNYNDVAGSMYFKCPNGSTVVFPPGGAPATVSMIYGSPTSSNTPPYVQLFAATQLPMGACGGGMGIQLTPAFYNLSQLSYAAVERRCYTTTSTPDPVSHSVPLTQ